MGRTTQPLPVAQAFGDRLRARRRQRGWTLERLGEEAGLHWTYVGSVERGERNVSLVNIVRLAAALGVDPSDLVGGLKP
ncbi:MAG: helix-turn-helix transcriptional regulator [Actinomycetota bacterium]|jgi:transcriptional regulator with XRE-family HTH domain|nr:helix-turn-helix transcriptional regulator [Actinomycetota bacterium]